MPPPCSPRGSRALPRGRVVREGTPVLSRGFAHTPTFLEPPDSLWGPRHPCAAHGGHLAAGEPCHGDAALLEKMLALPWRCSPCLGDARPRPLAPQELAHPQLPRPASPARTQTPVLGDPWGQLGLPSHVWEVIVPARWGVPYIECFPLSGCSESPALL